MDEIDLVNDLQEKAMERFMSRRKSQPTRINDWCNSCGDEIEPERLKYLPHAILCVSCQREYEAKHGR